MNKKMLIIYLSLLLLIFSCFNNVKKTDVLSKNTKKGKIMKKKI